MAKYALTTVDNPFNPFDDFTSWFLFDQEKGYNTCGLLARFAKTSDQFSDEEDDLEIERAIDEILSIDCLGLYEKIKKGDKIKITELEFLLNPEKSENMEELD